MWHKTGTQGSASVLDALPESKTAAPVGAGNGGYEIGNHCGTPGIDNSDRLTKVQANYIRRWVPLSEAVARVLAGVAFDSGRAA